MFVSYQWSILIAGKSCSRFILFMKIFNFRNCREVFRFANKLSSVCTLFDYDNGNRGLRSTAEV